MSVRRGTANFVSALSHGSVGVCHGFVFVFGWRSGLPLDNGPVRNTTLIAEDVEVLFRSLFSQPERYNLCATIELCAEVTQRSAIPASAEKSIAANSRRRNLGNAAAAIMAALSVESAREGKKTGSPCIAASRSKVP